MSDDLVNRLQTLSHPASESLPDGKRLTLLILIAREAANAIERKDAALRVALEELENTGKALQVCAVAVCGEDYNSLSMNATIAKIKEALND